MTVEQSEDLAAIIEIVKIIMMGHQFDADYALESVKELRQQATRQESMAVLNPSHVQSKNDLLRVQADTLEHLAKFYKGLQLCEEMKGKVAQDVGTREAINKLFI